MHFQNFSRISRECSENLKSHLDRSPAGALAASRRYLWLRRENAFKLLRTDAGKPKVRVRRGKAVIVFRCLSSSRWSSVSKIVVLPLSIYCPTVFNRFPLFRHELSFETNHKKDNWYLWVLMNHLHFGDSVVVWEKSFVILEFNSWKLLQMASSAEGKSEALLPNEFTQLIG